MARNDDAINAALDARSRAQQRLDADNYGDGPGPTREQLRSSDRQVIEDADRFLGLESQT